ncbi:hypothetical protein LguiA_022344 [Lonicera macranthoides]
MAKTISGSTPECAQQDWTRHSSLHFLIRLTICMRFANQFESQFKSPEKCSYVKIVVETASDECSLWPTIMKENA